MEEAMKGWRFVRFSVLLAIGLGLVLSVASQPMAKELPKLLSCTTYSVGSTGYAISMGLMEEPLRSGIGIWTEMETGGLETLVRK